MKLPIYRDARIVSYWLAQRYFTYTSNNQRHFTDFCVVSWAITLMLQVKLPVVDTIYPQSNKFVKGAKNKATGDLKLNDNPGQCLIFWFKSWMMFSKGTELMVQ